MSRSRIRAIQSLTAARRARYSSVEAQRLGREVRALETRILGVTYQQMTTTPYTVQSTSLKLGINIIGIAGPAGAVTVNIPTLNDPKVLVSIADERDPGDQGTITVNQV